MVACFGRPLCLGHTGSRYRCRANHPAAAAGATAGPNGAEAVPAAAAALSATTAVAPAASAAAVGISFGAVWGLWYGVSCCFRAHQGATRAVVARCLAPSRSGLRGISKQRRRQCSRARCCCSCCRRDGRLGFVQRGWEGCEFVWPACGADAGCMLARPGRVRRRRLAVAFGDAAHGAAPRERPCRAGGAPRAARGELVCLGAGLRFGAAASEGEVVGGPAGIRHGPEDHLQGVTARDDLDADLRRQQLVARRRVGGAELAGQRLEHVQHNLGELATVGAHHEDAVASHDHVLELGAPILFAGLEDVVAVADARDDALRVLNQHVAHGVHLVLAAPARHGAVFGGRDGEACDALVVVLLDAHEGCHRV
mmetsp:Transcript_1683/g.4279  ORF Transcript_1683/g.4279 Transcript_1683/m.4279 type:complete len:368 (+) Transcript_1683:127-1230(+)